MKTLLILIIVIGCTFNQGVAQSIESIQAGPKVGVNISHWGGDNFETKSRTGLHIGGFALLEFSDLFSLQPELMYSSQGAQSGSGRVKISVNYLNIPVLASITVYEGVYINIGPQLAFLLSANESEGGNGNVKEEYKSTDLSLVIGGGYKLPMGLHFHLRYNAGLSNFNNEAFFDEVSSNQVIQISVAYILWEK